MDNPKKCGICRGFPLVVTYGKPDNPKRIEITCAKCRKTVYGNTRDEAIREWDEKWGETIYG